MKTYLILRVSSWEKVQVIAIWKKWKEKLLIKNSFQTQSNHKKAQKDKIKEDLLFVKNPDRIEDSALSTIFDEFHLQNPLVNQIVENISSCTEFMDHSDVLKNLIEHEICSSAKKLVLMERNAFMKNLIIENEFENKTIEIISVPKQPDN